MKRFLKLITSRFIFMLVVSSIVMTLFNAIRIPRLFPELPCPCPYHRPHMELKHVPQRPDRLG